MQYRQAPTGTRGNTSSDMFAHARTHTDPVHTFIFALSDAQTASVVCVFARIDTLTLVTDLYTRDMHRL